MHANRALAVSQRKPCRIGESAELPYEIVRTMKVCRQRGSGTRGRKKKDPIYRLLLHRVFSLLSATKENVCLSPEALILL
jgi:hypothetical protein